MVACLPRPSGARGPREEKVGSRQAGRHRANGQAVWGSRSRPRDGGVPPCGYFLGRMRNATNEATSLKAKYGFFWRTSPMDVTGTSA